MVERRKPGDGDWTQLDHELMQSLSQVALHAIKERVIDMELTYDMIQIILLALIGAIASFAANILGERDQDKADELYGALEIAVKEWIDKYDTD